MKALVGVVIACSAALAALMLLVRGDAPAPAAGPQPELRDELAALRGAIDSLAMEVAALREARSTPGLRAPAPAREAVADPSARAEGTGELERLAAAVEELTDLLRTSRSASSGWDPRPGEREALLRREPDWSALARLGEQPAFHSDIAHLGWSIQQVFDRYGPPSRVYFSEGSLKLQYLSELARVTFELVDGAVVRVHP